VTSRARDSAFPFAPGLWHPKRVIRCPSCSSEVPGGSRFCGSCGASVSASAETPTETSLSDAPAGSVPRSRSGARRISVSSLDSLDQARFLPGTMVAGRYRIIGLLGRGGMGEVYRADDLKLGRPVALKFLPTVLERDESRLQRFLNEAKVALRVTHPNVCRVHDIGEVDGHHYLSMEYVDGEDLASLLRRIGRLPKDKAIQISRQLCAGLAAAHDEGILHRDLKPANVMIDGRGRAKITDFGLAGLAEEFRGAEVRAGTPGYMAPEQLAGKQVSVRSDLYSLGLVLYELFTGKPAFEASTPAELLRLEQQTTPTSPASLVDGLDPAVERVILRCLEKDPVQRPASALAVAAALPGGDPLAAAIAAGETPSPELVAEGGEAGGLSAPVAWALLGGALAMMALAFFLTGKTHLLEQVPLDKAPAYLEERAREVVRDLGYTEPPRDSASDFSIDRDYLRYLARTDRQGARERLAAEEPNAVDFWYRQSPDFLIGWNIGVYYNEPPVQVPGMVNLRLDAQGRLRHLLAVPSDFTEDEASANDPDWGALFEVAGFDLADFQPVEPAWPPPFYADSRAAWEGFYPSAPDVPIRIEAAAFHGLPVSFRIVEPWTEPYAPQDVVRGFWETASRIAYRLIFVLTLVGATILAFRNVRLGRADTKNAFRVAAFMMILRLGVWLIGAHHIPGQTEMHHFNVSFAFACSYSAMVWLYYVAMEPYLRRFWPRMLVSWMRLLDGRFRDPLVGRDVLVGCLYGWLFAVVFHVYVLAPPSLGLQAFDPAFVFGPVPAFTGIPQVFVRILWLLKEAVESNLLFLVILLLLRLALRRSWLAILAWVVVLVIWMNPSGVGLAYDKAALVTFILMYLAVLLRFGLLSVVVGTFFWSGSDSLVMTLDFSSWYPEHSLPVVVLGLGVALYGFYTSLAGRPAFGEDALEG